MMHDKFVERLALVAKQKRAKGGQSAVIEWWQRSFPDMLKTEFDRVQRALVRMSEK